jgi:transposase
MSATIIDKSVYIKAKKALTKLKSHATTANKLKAVISSYNNGITKVSEVFEVNPSSIYRWAVQIKNNEYDSLRNSSKLQDGIKLKNNHKNQIKLWLEKDPNLSILSVKERLEQYFNLIVSKSTTHRAMKSCGFSYITPRKNHYKQNKEKMDLFKKNSK